MCSIAHFSIGICAEASQIPGSQRRNHIRDFSARSSALKLFGMEVNMEKINAGSILRPDAPERLRSLFDACGMKKADPKKAASGKAFSENSVSGNAISGKDFSGVALITSPEGPVFSYACGYENLTYGIENRLDTAFDTASITKLFTAAGIVLLESRGMLGLEERIHSILDLGGTQIPEDVKLVHLLTHTAGIADDADEESGEDYSALFADIPNYSFRQNRDFLKNFVHKRPNFKPGEQIRYNNCAFILLGLAIEKLTGKDYRTFITEEIFCPFGMKNSFFAAKEETGRRFAEGYFYGADGSLKKNIYSFPPIGTADSGAYTTAEDLDRFWRYVNDSPVFHKMLLPHTEQKREQGEYRYTVGLGAELLERDGKIFRAWKEGSNDGVCNITAFYPEAELTFTILGNVDANVWRLHAEAERQMFCGR